MTSGSSAGSPGFRHPFDPSVWPDPYPAYRWIAEHQPLFDDPFSHMTFAVTYADADAVLRDRSVSNAQDQRQRVDPLPPSMLTSDPPEHTRLRAAATPLIGPAAVREITPKIESVAAATTRGFGGRDIDVVADIGRPFATGVLAELLDLAPSEWAQFTMLITAASGNLNPLADPAGQARAGKASGILAQLLTRRAEISARTPETPLGRFWASDELDEGQRTSTLMLVVIGAWEPLANLAATGTMFLAREPELLGELSERSVAEAYVDEVLRLESPIPFVARRTTAELDLPNGTIPADTQSLVLLAAANRDPAVFDDPGTLRLDRSPNRQLGFGAGVHHCPGAAMVRAAGAALFAAMARDYDAIAPVDDAEPTWRRSIVPRGLTEYRVRLTEPAA